MNYINLNIGKQKEVIALNADNVAFSINLPIYTLIIIEINLILGLIIG